MLAVTKKPNKEADAKKSARAGVSLNLYIDEDIRLALDGYIAAFNAASEHRATLRSCIEAALKQYLTGKGCWPPKPTE